MIKRRSPLLAAILTFFSLGLGQIYNGQPKKAFIFVLLINVVTIAFALFLLDYLFGLIVLMSFFLIFYAYAVVDGFVFARSQKDYELKIYNKWYIYVVYVVLVSLIASGGTSHLVKRYCHEAFKFPSMSMIPTIVPGDHILVKKLWLSRESVNSGDLILFSLPNAPTINIVKRVIGLPGQTVEVRKTQVFVDSKPLEEPYAIWVGGGLSDFAIQTVPKDKVFVLGDNRDRSKDSRFFPDPFVPISRIKGKPTFVYWNFGALQERMGVKLN